MRVEQSQNQPMLVEDTGLVLLDHKDRFRTLIVLKVNELWEKGKA